MSETEMTVKVARAINTVRNLLQEDSIVGFKIGKTDDCDRREKEHAKDGFVRFSPLVECNSLEEANQIESKLISIYSGDYRCMNEKDGGGGRFSNSDKHYIYIVVK